MTEKSTYAVFVTSGGTQVHRISVQAFPKFWAYSYLVKNGSENYLIDCGSGTETSHEELLNGLTQAGLQPSDLTYILLTHAHIDHFGGLSKLKPLTNAKVGCHALDLQTVAHHDARLALIGYRLASFLTETGLAEETRNTLLNNYRFTKAIYQSIPVDFTYESRDMQVGPFELIHLPGHCPGHVALRLDDVVFCGDMVVQGVTPHLAPESINPYSGLDHYLESLDRFQVWAKDARLILNGHDEPITDLHDSVQKIRQSIFRRMSKALTALSDPLTASEICTLVYGGMGGYNQLLVTEKTGAYVEYLYEHGMIEITNSAEMEQGQPAQYRRLRGENVLLEELARKINVEVAKQIQP